MIFRSNRKRRPRDGIVRTREREAAERAGGVVTRRVSEAKRRRPALDARYVAMPVARRATAPVGKGF